MNKEEKQKHDSDISNKYIANLNYDDSELDELSIQDMCVLVNNAKFALDKHIFVNAEENMPNLISKFYKILVKKVKEAETLYTVIDNTTGYPFIDENALDCIWLFSKKEYADYAVDYYTQQFRKFTIIEVQKDVNNELFSELYLNGITGAYIDNGLTGCVIKKEDLLEPPDYSNTPKISIPITNPKFMLAHLKMTQELSWRVNYEKREEELDKLELELCKESVTAKFLVPVKGMPNSDNTKAHEEILKKDTNISIPCLRGKDGANGIPAFTDWKQFRTVYSKDEFSGWIMSFDDLASMIKDNDAYSAFVVNVGKCPMTVNSKNLARIKVVLGNNKDEKEIKPEDKITAKAEAPAVNHKENSKENEKVKTEEKKEGLFSKIKKMFK